jgi:hypothetical protein
MPFIRGRYHINPVMGEALEAAREAEAALQALEHIARQKAGETDDESVNSAQISKGPTHGPVHRVEIEAAEMVPAHSGRGQRGYAMRIHRLPPTDSTADADTESDGAYSDYGSQPAGANGFPARGAGSGQSDTHIFSNHNDLLDFLRDELANASGSR